MVKVKEIKHSDEEVSSDEPLSGEESGEYDGYGDEAMNPFEDMAEEGEEEYDDESGEGELQDEEGEIEFVEAPEDIE